MKYNPTSDIFKEHPELIEYPEFKFEFGANETRFDLQAAFAYVIHAYDPESPLFKIDDPKERKERAFKRSGLPSSIRAEVVENRNERINAMVLRFFRLLANSEIELYLSGQEAVHTLLEEARRPVSGDLQDDKRTTALKAKKMCYEDAMEIIQQLKKLSEQFDNNRIDIKQIKKAAEVKVDEWADTSHVEKRVLGK